jgi:hypothetical protein
MRRFAITLAILSACLGALGQGKVMFGNDSNHLFVLGRPWTGDPSGPIPASPLPSGLFLMAVLYAGTSSGNLQLQTSVLLDASGWLTDGRMVNKAVVLTGVPGGAVAYFQIFITDTGALLPATIAGGYYSYFSGATYFGTSSLFTATPGASISYPGLVPGGPSGSTWAAGPIDAAGCLSCGYFPRFTVNPSSRSVALGSDVTLYALATSYADCCYPMGYQWRKDEVTITGAKANSLTLTNIHISDAGNYDVVAYNVYGVAYSLVATLTVIAPAIPATLGSPTYTTNNQFQFTVTGTVGSNYVVQVSTNLATSGNWVSLFTNASPFTFVDSNANSFPQKFYRAYSP